MSIETLFEGQELSEEFKTKVAAVFEATVVEAVAEKEKQLQEQHEAQLTKLQEGFDAKLTEASEQYETQLEQYIETEVVAKVDAFLNYVAEQWMEENKLAVESGLKTEMTESFLQGLHKLFAEHYVEVPDEKLDLVAEMEQNQATIEAKLDEVLSENIEMKNFIRDQAKAEVVAEMCEGLADTQVERLKTIAEGIEFKSIEQFEQKLAVVRDTMMVESTREVAPAKKDAKPLNESASEMGGLLAELTRLAPKR